MEFEEISPNVWKPEKDGDVVEGKLVGKREKVGVNESNAYNIETKDDQVMVWGSAVLDSRMEYIEIGNYVRLTYKGVQKNAKGQDTKIFKVEKAKDLTKVKEEVVKET